MRSGGEGGEGGYPVRVRVIKSPMILSSFGDSHASARLRLGGNRSLACCLAGQVRRTCSTVSSSSSQRGHDSGSGYPVSMREKVGFSKPHLENTVCLHPRGALIKLGILLYVCVSNRFRIKLK
jgi:hypothetical protein